MFEEIGAVIGKVIDGKKGEKTGKEIGKVADVIFKIITKK
jgi:hypothetical protein